MPVDVEHLVSLFTTNLLSQIREDFLKMLSVGYLEIEWNFCHGRVPNHSVVLLFVSDVVVHRHEVDQIRFAE